MRREKVSRLAVGTPAPSPTATLSRARRSLAGRRLPGMPLGTRGGTRMDYTFPHDGDYAIAAAWRATSTRTCRTTSSEQDLEISVDGERVRCSR